MPSLSIILPVLSALLTGYFAVLVFRHDKAGPNRRRELVVLLGALSTAILAVATPWFSWVDSLRSDAESRERFVAQLTRLDTIVGRTADLSVLARALTDSLSLTLAIADSSLAQHRIQTSQQQGVLESLQEGAELQAIQLRDQQRIMRTQQQMGAEAWRLSFPLDTVIGIYASVEYPADSVGLNAFADSLLKVARTAAARHSINLAAGYREEDGQITGVWYDSIMQGMITYHVERGNPILDEVWLQRRSGWVHDWPDDNVRSLLRSGSIIVSISNERTNPPLAMLFLADPDTSDAIFQLDRNRSPIEPYRITVDIQRRTVGLHFAVSSVYVAHRTANLSVLDLPCSKVLLRAAGTWHQEHARVTGAVVYFGFSEYQWQARVRGTELTQRRPGEWQTTLHPTDIFQTMRDDEGSLIRRELSSLPGNPLDNCH